MDKRKIFPYTSCKDITFYTRCFLGMAHFHVWPTFGFIVCPYYSLLWQCQCPWALPTMIVISKNVIIRRWQIGRYFITTYARHSHFHREEACKRDICMHSSCFYRYSRAKWQITQVGKKSILVHNEVKHHMPIRPGSFLLGRVGMLDFCCS